MILKDSWHLTKMLLEKYTPKSTKEIIGNSAAVMEIKKFLSGWRRGKAALVHGPPGSGKSTAIRLAAQELGYEVIEARSDEKRSFSDYCKASVQQGLFSKRKLLLFEDMETMTTRGFSDLTGRSEHPVVCTIGDLYQLAPAVRKNFKTVKFEKVRDSELAGLLENVCKKENIQLERRQLEQLVKTSNGDIRGLLIDLEMLIASGRISASIGYRDSEDNIFNTLKVIFKTMSLENSRIAVRNCEKEPEEMVRWLEENIAEEYTDTNAIATAFDYLSKADIFNTRIIRRQSWGLQKYVSLAAYGTSLAKTRPSARFVSYKYPTFMKRGDSALAKIAASFHVSKKRAAVYIPLLRMLGKNNPNLLDELGMDEREVSILLGKR